MRMTQILKFFCIPLFFIAWISNTFAANMRPYPPYPYVDLHAHLFMKEGMGFLFCGGFHGPLHANSWDDKLSSQANPASLEASKLGVVVVSLYATRPLTPDPQKAIRKQIQMAEKFVARHPSWVLAKNPTQALQAYQSGKRIMILSLEGASDILETEEDLKEFIDQRGIRIVTFAHLLEDHYSGTALLKGMKGLGSSPISWIRSHVIKPHYCEGVNVSDSGLKPRGLALAEALLARKVWIDLTHASDHTQEALIPLMQQAGQPLLYTHTVLRKYHRAERALADWQLRLVKKSGGIIGLMPVEDMLSGTRTSNRKCGGVFSLAKQYNEVANVVGPQSTLIGSDFNGAVVHLKPPNTGEFAGIFTAGERTGSAGDKLGRKSDTTQCKTSTSLDGPAGLWNIGQTPDLWMALQNVGANVQPSIESGALQFLKAWQRAWDGNPINVEITECVQPRPFFDPHEFDFF